MKTQTDDRIGTEEVGSLIYPFERFAAQLFRIANELARCDADQHTQTAKRCAQPVAWARSDPRDVPVPFDDPITVQLIEGHDGLGRNHRSAPAAGAGTIQAVVMAAVMPQTSPSVLVIRLDAIGDALALTPLLAALSARAIPVDVVLRAVNAEIFSSRAVRAAYVAPFALRSSTTANRQAIAAFGMRLRKNGYTHVLVATEDPGGYRLARAVAAPQRIGFVNGWGKPFKTLWARSMLTSAAVRSAGLDPKAPHECDVLWKLGESLVNGDRISRDPGVLRPMILDTGVPREAYIAFQVSDKWERLGIGLTQVVDALRAAGAVGTVRAIASASEGAYAQRIADAAHVQVERYTSLRPWKAAIAGAAALVAPDSGAVHVAGMVGTPTVAVYPPIRDLDLQIARWAPWAAPYRSVSAEGGWPNDVSVSLHELLVR